MYFQILYYNQFLFRKMLKTLFIVSVLIVFAASKCMDPPPAYLFNIDKYKGKWYQIAKYQTAGGAYFEKNCTCTEMDIGLNNSKIYANQYCNKSGKITGVNATLVPTSTPGKFIQQIGNQKANYYVIQLDDSTAIQYDCQTTLGITNYCIHIMAKQTAISKDKLQALSSYALSLGLNVNNLPRQITEQAKCRSEGWKMLRSQ